MMQPPQSGDRFTVDGRPHTVARFVTVLMLGTETRYLVADARGQKWLLRRLETGALLAVPTGPER